MPLSNDALKQQLASRAHATSSGVTPASGGAPPPGGPQGVFDVSNDGINWHPAVRLTASTGTAFVVTNGEAVLTGQNAGMVEHADHATFRASPAPADGAVFRIISPPGEFRYSSSTGAGWADDDDTLLKPASVNVNSNGRAYSTRASEHAATFEAFRAMKGLLGRAKHVHVESHTTFGDGGGGVLDVRPVGPYVDNDCTVFVNGTAAGIRRDADGVSVSAAWCGLDRTGGVDCTSKLQALHDAIEADTEVQFPRGTYLVQGWLISKALKLKGRGATIQTNNLSDLAAIELSAGGCTFEGLTFDGDRWNQSGAHSDNILYHRRRSAISTNEVSCDDITIANCEFTNFYQSAVLLIGDRISVSNCKFLDTNISGVMVGYHSSDATVHSDGVALVDCIFERIGTRTSAVDAREYGNDLPGVTGDAVLIRGRNVRITGCRFIEVDRCPVKFECPRNNFVIDGNIVHNSYAGNSAYCSFAFQNEGGDFTPSATTPSNVTITNNVSTRPTGFFNTGLVSLWGVTLANNRIVVPAGGLANGVFRLDECRDVRITGNRVKCSVVSGMVIKVGNTRAVSPHSGLYIIDNDLDAAFIGILLAVAQTDIQIKNNRLVTGTAPGIWGGSDLDSVIISDNTLYDIRFTDGVTANKTNFVIVRNDFGKYLESFFGSVLCRDNTFKTIATFGRAILGVFNQGTDSRYSTSNSGEMAFLPDGDTTPSVKARELFFAKQTNATSITGFDDPPVGKTITVIFLDGNTTIVAGARMKLAGGVNFVGTANDSITLRYIFDTSVGELGWVEIARSVN